MGLPELGADRFPAMTRLVGAFILVGLLNTLFSYALFALLIYCKLHYSLAVLLSTVLGVLFNFKMTGKLVFKSDDNRLIYRFVVVYGVVYLFNLAGLRIYRIFDNNLYLAGLLMIAPAALLSFVLLSRFVFKRQTFGHGGTATTGSFPEAAERGRHE